MSVYSDAAAFIAKFEGHREHAYWDVNHYRIGYGSDTVGSGMTPCGKNSTETREEAIINLQMRIPRFVGAIAAQIGSVNWSKLSPNEQIALIDIAYNYGRLPHSVAWACTHGGTAAISHAIINHEHDNQGINARRRSAEAALVSGMETA